MNKSSFLPPAILAAMLLAILLLPACRPTETGSADGSPATPTPLPTPIIPEKPRYTVEVGSVVETLEFTGRASPVREQELFFKTDGFVSQVNVQRGDWVEAGTVLAELEVGDLESQLAQNKISLETAQIDLERGQDTADLDDGVTSAEINLQEAQNSLQSAIASRDSDQASLEALLAGPDELELESASADLLLAQIDVQLAQAAYDKIAWQDNVGASQEAMDLQTATINYDKAKLTYESIAAGATAAEKAAAQAQVLQSQIQVSNAGLALQTAKLSHQQALRERDAHTYDLRVLQLNVDKAQLDIADLEAQLADARLIAPFDGQVISLGVSPGDSATAYSAVMVLADPNTLEITAERGAEELSQMALNQAALITLRNRPGEKFGGVITQLPYPYGGGTVELDTGDVAVHITPDDGVSLALGELVTVVIILQEKEDVLWLPPAAIRTYQGRDFVVVEHPNGQQQRVDVLVGVVTDERVEITAGVEAGQIVVGE